MSVPNSPADILGNSGDLPVITFRGVDYKVSWPTPKSLTVIANEIARIAVQQAKEVGACLPPSDAAKLMNHVFSQITARENQIGGELWEYHNNNNLNANTYLLWALVKENHPVFSLEDAKEMQLELLDETQAILLMVAPRFLELTLAKQPMTKDQKDLVRARVQGLIAETKSKATS